MKLSWNVGGWDRGVRIILGIVLIALASFGVLRGTLAIIGYVIAGIALLTGIIKFCPASALLGINTCKPNLPKSDT